MKIVIILLISISYLIGIILLGYKMYKWNKELINYRYFTDEEIKIISNEFAKAVINDTTIV